MPPSAPVSDLPGAPAQPAASAGAPASDEDQVDNAGGRPVNFPSASGTSAASGNPRTFRAATPPGADTHRPPATATAPHPSPGTGDTESTGGPPGYRHAFGAAPPTDTTAPNEYDEESDVLRRAFMTGGPAALAAASLSGSPLGSAHAAVPAASGRAGEAEVSSVERTVRQIRVLDDRHGGDGLYRRAGDTLRAAYRLLDADTHRQSVSDRLHSGAGELAISVGWLAHDSGRLPDARSHYAEALATARVAGDPALEAHAFCNTAFLARDADRPREAVRAAQAGQLAAKSLGSGQLLSLLALREAGGWAGLGDRGGCREALTRAHQLFTRGPSEADPEWMSFFGPAELAGLEAQCWSALGDWKRAAECAERAVALQDPHFARNTALFTAELAGNLAAQGKLDEAAAAGSRALSLLEPVRSSRILGMLHTTAHRLRGHQGDATVAEFLDRYHRQRGPAGGGAVRHPA
ncbi:tetratricopeptide repeat protein [Streptomyces sp. AJS327]|uniref:tetratricopeptide repeat protein n=1 Tax=Streptomyces sp. AJS327 TaxID=2545265 RepID=UPI0035B518C2